MESKNLIASKISAKDLITGEFVESGGTSFVRTKKGIEISKIRILGTVVDKFISKDKNYGFITIDDATETISARFFKEDMAKLNDLSVGDILDIIGFMRQYENEIYISPNIIKKLDDPNWELLRKLELMGMDNAGLEGTDISSIIIEKLRELDSGEGVQIEQLIKSLNIYNNSKVIEGVRQLMFKGELFEPRKGILKVIE